MAKCDLCGETCKASELEQVLPTYQVEGVVDVCPACSRWATKIKSEMISEIASEMRKAIAARKGVPLRRRWWQFGAG